MKARAACLLIERAACLVRTAIADRPSRRDLDGHEEGHGKVVEEIGLVVVRRHCSSSYLRVAHTGRMSLGLP